LNNFVDDYDENWHLLLVLSLLMSGLKLRMTTPVIIDDKCVSVNHVSFGAHFLSRVKKKLYIWICAEKHHLYLASKVN